MGDINQQAVTLNELIEGEAEPIYNMLSKRGKAIFFPKKGILAQAAQAKEKEINATIGQALDNDLSTMVLGALANQTSMDTEKVFPYTGSYGNPDLRKLWRKHIYDVNPSLDSEISKPVVTHAITNAMYLAGMMFCDPGQKVIVPDRYWGNYNLTFDVLQDLTLDKFSTFEDNGFNVDGLKEKLEGTGQHHVVILNFPNNPTGYTATEEEAEQIADVIRQSAENDNYVTVLCDDAYFGLVYKDGIYKESIFSKLADLHENVLAVKADGVTKEYNAWGLRLGFLTYASKGMTQEVAGALEDKTAGMIRGMNSNENTQAQNMMINALNNPNLDAQMKERYEKLKVRHDEIIRILEENPKYDEVFEPLPFNSGYFMAVKLKNGDAGAIREKLLKEESTGLISIGDDIIRVAYSSTPTEKIPLLFDRLYKVCMNHKP